MFLRSTLLSSFALLILLQTGCGSNQLPSATAEPKFAYHNNAFLYKVSTATQQVDEVDSSKVINTPGTKRSFIVLNMKTSPDEDAMKTVLITLDAFEKKFKVTVVPGGWKIIWSPNTHYRDPFIHGICVDHDSPIDLSNPGQIRLDGVTKDKKSTLEKMAESGGL